MKSIGARLALWYTLATTGTMAGSFIAGRYLLEKYVVHSVDLLIQDEFAQIRSQLGPDCSALGREQIRERMLKIANSESVLFYVEIHRTDGDILFNSPNLGGLLIPEAAGADAYNVHLPGLRFEMRVDRFRLGPLIVSIMTSKEQVLGVMRGYRAVFLGLTAFMLGMSAAIGLLLSRMALRPVRLIQETATHIGSDNLSERIPVPAVHDEISNLARLLNQMFDRIESSFNQIRRFSAEASHELKTPLSLIRLQAERLLIEGRLAPAQEEAVQVQLEEIARLNQIIEELLFLSRAEARAITLVTRREDPRAFLHYFALDARVLVEHRDLRFAESVAGSGLVDFDPKWIRQVLLNLLANSLNVAPRGSLIRVSSIVADGAWRVAVEDEGPGVPREERERIFERFVRLAEADGSLQEKGSGLGLAISRSIVGLHRGRIWAEERSEGPGLRVIFELPAVPELVPSAF